MVGFHINSTKYCKYCKALKQMGTTVPNELNTTFLETVSFQCVIHFRVQQVTYRYLQNGKNNTWKNTMVTWKNTMVTLVSKTLPHTFLKIIVLKEGNI